MKKFTAMLCVAAMTLGMSATALANPSMDLVSAEGEVAVSAETAENIPEGKKIAVIEASPENYENRNVSDVVTRLNDDEQLIDMAGILETLEVDTEQEILTVQENPIDPTAYEPINKFRDLVLTDDVIIEYDFDGEVLEVTVTVTIESLKDVEDVWNYVLMQMDPKTGDVYFIEIDADDLDPETGELTVTFPCLGPFTLLQRTELLDEPPVVETEAETNLAE